MTVFSDNIIDTLNRLGYQLKFDGDTGLTIAKTTNNVEQHYIPETEQDAPKPHGRLDLKGLILTTSDSDVRLVAPGCNVPLDQPDDEQQVRGYSIGRDGILYRFYHHDGQWRFSTTGKIVPDTFWGAKGTPTFQQLAQEAIDDGLVNFDKLTPGYCYYAVLESPRFTNLVKHHELKLTLVDIVDCTTHNLQHLPIDTDSGFKMHEQMFHEQPEILEVDDEVKIGGPLTSNDIGFNVHYVDRNIFRYENSTYKRAAKIRPNLTDPAQQWVNLIKDGGHKLVVEFLTFFPWHQALFDQCQIKLDTLIDTLVENYKQLATKKCHIPPRHVAYMRDLMDEVHTAIDDIDLQEDIYKHLMNEDVKRIYYLINPYDVQPHVRQSTHKYSPPGKIKDGQMTL